MIWIIKVYETKTSKEPIDVFAFGNKQELKEGRKELVKRYNIPQNEIGHRLKKDWVFSVDSQEFKLL